MDQPIDAHPCAGCAVRTSQHSMVRRKSKSCAQSFRWSPLQSRILGLNAWGLGIRDSFKRVEDS